MTMKQLLSLLLTLNLSITLFCCCLNEAIPATINHSTIANLGWL